MWVRIFGLAKDFWIVLTLLWHTCGVIKMSETLVKDHLTVLQETLGMKPNEFYEHVARVTSQELNILWPNKLLYDMDNKRFGETWAENHVKSFDKRFKKAKADHHDLILEEIKVEVKASRASSPAKNNLSLFQRALMLGTSDQFMMNYIHIFFDEPDVFVFVSVWKNDISYYVMSRSEVEGNKYLQTYQTEYQMAITDANINEFENYKVKSDEIADVILNKIRN